MLGVKIEDGEKGVTINEVLKKSPAEKAGLKKDDVITHARRAAGQEPRGLTAALKNTAPARRSS